MKTIVSKWIPPLGLLLITLGLWAFNAIAIPPPTPPATTSAIVFSWTPSPSDTGTNGGFYTILALPTNAASIQGTITLTNVPAGATNVWVPVGFLPGNPCFVFAQFQTMGATSALTGPLYVDTNSIFAWQPVAPFGLRAATK